MKNNTATLPAAPDFPRNATWLNTDGLSMQSLAGKVVLLHFWDYTSVCCLEAMPYIRAWYSRYTSLGLALVGVHTPEFPFARTRGAVRSAVTALELHYPILLDNKFDLWKAYGNTFWPSYHLIDARGVLRYSDVGEGAWLGVESVLQDLLREAGATGPLPDLCEPLRPRDEPGVPSWPVTANVYTGYDRGSIGNSEGSDPHRVVFYEEVDGPLKEGSYYLEGKWLNHRFCAAVAKAAEGTEASIHVPYTAAEVCMVVNPSGDQGFLVDVYDNREPLTEANAGPHVRLVEDGEERRSQVLIHDPKVYRLIKHDRVRSGVLKVTARSSGFTVYAFTFLSSPFKEGVETSEAVTALIEGTAAPSLEESVLGVVPEPELPTAVEAPADADVAGDDAGKRRAPRAPKSRGKAAEPASSPEGAPVGEGAGEQAAAAAGEAPAGAEASPKPSHAPKARASRSKAKKGVSDGAAVAGAAAGDAPSAASGDGDGPPAAVAAADATEAASGGTVELPESAAAGAQEIVVSAPDGASLEDAGLAVPADGATAQESGPPVAVPPSEAQADPGSEATEQTVAASLIFGAMEGEPPATTEAAAPAAEATAASPKRSARSRRGAPAAAEPAPEPIAEAADPKPDQKHGKRAKAGARLGSTDEPRILLQLSRPRKRTMRRAAPKPDAGATKRAKSADAQAKPAAAGPDVPKPRRQARTSGTNGEAHKEHEAPAVTPPDPLITEGSPAAPVEV